MRGQYITVKPVHSPTLTTIAIIMLSALSFTRPYIRPASTPIAPYGALPPAAGGSFIPRTAIARFACASVKRSPHRLFCYRPRFRVGARYLSTDHFRIRSFRKRGLYLKNPMRLLRILLLEAYV